MVLTTVSKRFRLEAGRLQHTAMQSLINRISRLTLHHIDVDGCTIPYLQGGTGPAVVLLHGFADTKETWFLLFRQLSHRYTVIAPDLPGYGAASPIDPERATLEAQAIAVTRFLDALGRRRVHLCGNSMGGGIAARIALRWPERVASMTLLSPIGPVREPSEAQLMWETGQNPLLPRTVEEYDAMLQVVLERQLPLTRALRTYLAERQSAMHDDLAAYFQVLADPSPDNVIPEDLDHVTTPTLVLHGERDRVIHPSSGQAYAELMPNARFVLLDGVGHAPQLEAPRITARYLDRQIRSM